MHANDDRSSVLPPPQVTTAVSNHGDNRTAAPAPLSWGPYPGRAMTRGLSPARHERLPQVVEANTVPDGRPGLVALAAEDRQGRETVLADRGRAVP